MREPEVLAVHRSGSHSFSKETVREVDLVAGWGVAGDAHGGARVRHRSRVQSDPTQPNLRQIHLMQAELFAELQREDHVVGAGDLGENITTRDVDLLSLPTGTVLKLGAKTLIALTGLRNPCAQIEAFQKGLLELIVGRDDSGEIVRRAGVMGVVLSGGTVRPGDPIQVAAPPGAPIPLKPV